MVILVRENDYALLRKRGGKGKDIYKFDRVRQEGNDKHKNAISPLSEVEKVYEIFEFKIDISFQFSDSESSFNLSLFIFRLSFIPSRVKNIQNLPPLFPFYNDDPG